MAAKPKPCNETCPKCGNADVNRSFHPKGHKFKPYDNKIESSYRKEESFIISATQDIIAHHCRCCHYEWDGLPLASPKTKSKTVPKSSVKYSIKKSKTKPKTVLKPSVKYSIKKSKIP